MRSFAFCILFLSARVLACAAGAGEDKAPSQLRLELDLADGSHIIGVPGIESVPVQTSYAKMEIPLKEILSMKIGEDHETVSVDLRNGDKVKGVVGLGPIKLATVFGKVSVSVQHIRRISVVISGGPLPAALREGQVLYYPFDNDQEEGKAADESGKRNDGQLFKGARLVNEDRHGKVLELDGVAAHIRVPGTPDFHFTNVTVAAWLRPDVGNGAPLPQPVVSTARPSSAEGGLQVLFYAPGVIQYVHRSPGAVRTESVPLGLDEAEGGKWHFMATSYAWNNGQYTVGVYLDGKLVRQDTTAADPMAYAGQVMHIGIQYDSAAADMGMNYPRQFKGRMDEIRIFNRALSEIEVRQLYDARK